MLSLEELEEVWRIIESEYYEGRIVSERDLQAHLACTLKTRTNDSARVVVEPVWHIDQNRLIPDLVLTTGNTITDIFEIKFVPYAMADAKGDLRKLVTYADHEGPDLPVSIVPETGSWQEGVPLEEKCRLHFVAISSHHAAAVWPDCLPDEAPILADTSHSITHWYGRIRADGRMPGDWGIQQCI